MDYARFIRLRRPVWDDFERQIAASRKDAGLSHADLEEMALRYRQVLHDHALADARYPGTAAAARLRVLALQGTHRLIRDRGERGGLVSFFTRTFPKAFRAQLGLLGVTTALFLFATFWGLAIAANRPALGLAFLGPEAIRGLEEGRMWTESLVSTVPPSISSSRIATNNISVALSDWSGGLLAGIVPLYVVLLNGMMLGSIVGITMRYSMAGELLEFVSAHGPLEITLILVSAAAGLGIGRALVAAGDRPRSLALRDAGRDALTVLLGCVPWFVVLALVEVFISPSPDLPAALKAVLGLSLEILFLLLALNPFSRKAQEIP
ncbi:MAG TPA: stage II sporulation protein M [Thermoanaerobaculia bacterium]|nr:stage II sporulation protein M [Thermoanaerobaculia bacterium]